MTGSEPLHVNDSRLDVSIQSNTHKSVSSFIRFSAVETPPPPAYSFNSPKAAVSSSTSLATPPLSVAKPSTVLSKRDYYYFNESILMKGVILIMHFSFCVCVSAPVRPVQTSTPPTAVQKPAPAPQSRVQAPQVLSVCCKDILPIIY